MQTSAMPASSVHCLGLCKVQGCSVDSVMQSTRQVQRVRLCRAQRIERKQEALQRRMLELKNCITRQRAAAARRAAAASPLPRLPAAVAASILSASSTSGDHN